MMLQRATTITAAHHAAAATVLAQNAYSTQFNEGIQSGERPTTSRHAPTHMPDRGADAHTTTGRSSELTSARVAEDGLQRLAERVLMVYAARGLEQQRSLIAELYSEHAV